jgi:uncharacterized protein (DUF58 family)
MVRVAVLGVVAVLVLGGLFVVLRPDPPAAGPEERTVEVELQADGMNPSEITVGESDRVTLSFTADRPRGLHLHGYDRQVEVEPGETATLSFKATRTGRFEVEDHDTGAELGTLIVEPRREG